MGKSTSPQPQILTPAAIAERKLFVIATQQPDCQPVFTNTFLRLLLKRRSFLGLSFPQATYVAKIVCSETLCKKYGVFLVHGTEKIGIRLVVIPGSKLGGWLVEARALWAKYREPPREEAVSHYDRLGKTVYAKRKGVAGYIR